MIRINLLPVRATARLDAVKQELALAGLALGVVVLALGGLYVVVGSQASTLSAENQQLQTEIDNLKAIVVEVDEFERKKEEYNRKLDVIRRLKAGQEGPVHMLDELSLATPEKLTITGLKERGGNIELSGLAVSYEVVAQFLTNLERSAWFKDVELDGIDQVDQDGYKLKRFVATTRVVVPALSDEQQEEGL
ncbi:MAG: PilN domain-containing protein [Myxococcota bacterium]|nr:PilN domain-containing protein [Myxococcota bacterium]